MPNETVQRRRKRQKLPIIGAQVSAAGGFTLVPERAMAIGADAVQIFNSNPRIWRARPIASEEMTNLTQGLKQHGLPLFIHSIYLINLASPDKNLQLKSATALAEALTTGALASAAGVVTHIGSHRGDGFPAAVPRVREAIRVAVDMAKDSLRRDIALPPLLLENSAGAGSTLGAQLEELAILLEQVTATCGLCLDTAHLFAAGHAVHTAVGLERLIEELIRRDLMRTLGLIHLNDSATPFASVHDQHENLGKGNIGAAGLSRVLRHPAFAPIPFVLEVPGEDGHGPDAINISCAKLMRSSRP